jgi:hypothetical protein
VRDVKDGRDAKSCPVIEGPLSFFLSVYTFSDFFRSLFRAVHSGSEPARFKGLFGGFWKPPVPFSDPYANAAQRLFEEGVVGRALEGV